jgi:hypothetical protein
LTEKIYRSLNGLYVALFLSPNGKEVTTVEAGAAVVVLESRLAET